MLICQSYYNNKISSNSPFLELVLDSLDTFNLIDFTIVSKIKLLRITPDFFNPYLLNNIIHSLPALESIIFMSKYSNVIKLVSNLTIPKIFHPSFKTLYYWHRFTYIDNLDINASLIYIPENTNTNLLNSIASKLKDTNYDGYIVFENTNISPDFLISFIDHFIS